jgi:Putative beta-barrel porin-2, OmpL-like. bbp2
VNLLDGNLTTVALTDIGPENPGNNRGYRFLNDMTTTWKITKPLTSITERNLVYDQLGSSWGGGFAQYFTYSLNDCLTLGLRAEIWRDENNFYVAQFGGNNDFIHIERGDPTASDPSTYFGGKTTCFEVTWGVTLKPPVPKPLTALLVRPEVRYDRALTDNFSPFDQHTDKDQWTLALDIILQF